MNIWNAFFVCLPLFFLPHPAAASTFCLAGNGMAPQCIYDDAALCRQAASESTSVGCIVNPDSTLSYNGGSTYCVVGSDLMAECLYVDRNQCRAVASQRRAVCVSRDSRAGDENNPYRYDPRVQN
jgi:hypothetical protein